MHLAAALAAIAFVVVAQSHRPLTSPQKQSRRAESVSGERMESER